MTVRHTSEPHQAVIHDREMHDAKCPHCKKELPKGVDIIFWQNPPWITVCAKCPFCDVGLSFFVMPMEQAQPTGQPS